MQRVSFEVSGGYHSDAEAGNSGQMSGGGGQLPTTSNSRFTAGNSQRTRTAPYVDLTVDVQDDRVSVHSLKMEGGSSVEESPELTLLKRNRLEKKTTVVKRLASVSHELKRLTSVSGGVGGGGGRKPPRPAKLDRTKSAATQALKGLKFISKTDGGAGWSAVEKRFNQITATTGGLLLRTKFGECIGKD